VVAHADHFLVALFFRRYFDPDKVSEDAYVKQYFDEVFPSFEDRYVSTVQTVNLLIQKKAKGPAYNHPKYFKSENGFNDLTGLFDDSEVTKAK
jgi:hypothetical protein